MENYIQKVWQVEQAYHNPAPNAKWKPTREDLEQYEIDRERTRETQESFKIVERVVGEKEEMRDGQPMTLFLCKWTNLHYAECTWECEQSTRLQAPLTISLR